MDKPSPGRTGYRVSGSTLTTEMNKLKVGDIVKMKTCKEIKDKDDLWEVMQVTGVHIVIRSVGDFCRSPKVASHPFDSSLVVKVL